MKALVFDGPAVDASRTRVSNMPVPDCGDAQVLIEVAYAGVNFMDVMVRRGDPGYVPGWPTVPGVELAGTVRRVGASVGGVAIGDSVAALTNAGGLAEFALADADLTVKLSAGLPLSVAAVAPGALTTAELLLTDFARARAGDVIVAHSAAGAVGEAIGAIARSLGSVTLIGVAGSDDRAAQALSSGYDAVFVRAPDLAPSVRHRLDGRGADIILDPHGTQWLDADLEVLSPGGRIVIFGNASGGELATLPATGSLFAKNASIGAFSLAALSKTNPTAIRAAMVRVLDRLVSGTLAPRISVVSGLEQAADLHQALAEGRGVGKYVIEVAPIAPEG